MWIRHIPMRGVQELECFQRLLEMLQQVPWRVGPAKALEMNMNGIMIIIPANWTTSGRRRRSPILPNNRWADPCDDREPSLRG